MKPGNLVYYYDPSKGQMFGVIIKFIDTRCEIFWDKEIPHWMPGSNNVGKCSAHILKVIQ